MASSCLQEGEEEGESRREAKWPAPRPGSGESPATKHPWRQLSAGRGLAGCRGGCALMKEPPGGTALTCFGSRGNVCVIKAPSLPVKFPSLPGEGAEQKQVSFCLPFPDELETCAKTTKKQDISYPLVRASLVAQTVKILSATRVTWVQSLGREDPLGKGMEPTPVFLPGKFHDRGAWWATVHGVTKW